MLVSTQIRWHLHDNAQQRRTIPSDKSMNCECLYSTRKNDDTEYDHVITVQQFCQSASFYAIFTMIIELSSTCVLSGLFCIVSLASQVQQVYMIKSRDKTSSFSSEYLFLLVTCVFSRLYFKVSTRLRSPDSKVSVLSMCFHRLLVNRRPKLEQIFGFLLKMESCKHRLRKLWFSVY